MIALRLVGNPRFKHDCSSCVYLGSTVIDSVERSGVEEFDLYVCPAKAPGAKAETVVARFGEDGNYHSGLEFGRTAFNNLPTMVYAGCGAIATAYALAKIHGWDCREE